MPVHPLSPAVDSLLRSAECAGYRVRRERKQNLSLSYQSNEVLGGWDSRSRWWYVPDKRLSDTTRALACRLGFERGYRKSGYIHWRLRGEDAASAEKFRLILQALTSRSI